MSVPIAIVGGFASGVGARSLLFTNSWPILFIALLAALTGAAMFLIPRRVYALATLFFIFVALGMVRAAVAHTPVPQAFASDLRHRVSYDGVVVGDPDVREKNQRIAVRVEKGSERVGALAVVPLSTSVAVGDRVRVTGTLYLPQPFETDNGRVFRYDQYLAARGIRFLIEFGSMHVIEPAAWYSVNALLARVKHTFLDGLDRALPEPASALAGGIVIGGKNGLPQTLQNAFITSGLIQIVVLSGYNVMIVAEWAMAFFALWRLPRRLQVVAGGAVLLLFVGIAGLSSTAVRATLMALIALYARATGKSYAAGRALLVAVVGMLIWNPLLLCFDPGFALSVTATAGIIWLSPRFEEKLRARWERLVLSVRRVRQVQRSETLSESGVRAARSPFWANAVATTLAAQLSVLPLLLYFNGLFSLVALPANLFVNPIVPFAMAAAAGAGMWGMIAHGLAPALTHLIGLPALAAIRYIIFVVEKSAALPYAALTLAPFPFWIVLLSYAALIALSYRFSTTDQLRFAKKASM